MDEQELLRSVADYSAEYIDSLGERPIRARATVEQLRAALGGPLPEQPVDADEVVADLIEGAEPGVVALGSGRYFGFVIGGALPAALAADWLTSVWDQNAGLYVGGPSAAVVEEVALGWLRELFGLPSTVSGAFVTGCQMAHVTCLAAARNYVLAQAGWDVERQGLAGAPPVRVLAGEELHVTVPRALRFLGLGTDTVVTLPVDRQGRMRSDALAQALGGDGGPTIVCAQVGNVNTGAIDPMEEVADAAEQAGAWLHVDGAFGLWAAAAPSLRPLVAGIERADSWATDAHKWLNVPYDSGIALCAHPDAHRAAMGVTAVYLEHAEDGARRDQMDWTPEFSRRARGFAVYAALRSLGRAGVADLVERLCERARLFAQLLGDADGVEVLNDVVLNQVLVRIGDDDERTRAAVPRVQDDGTCWLSGTTWHDRAAIRISVSNWRTTEDDVRRSVGAILRAAD